MDARALRTPLRLADLISAIQIMGTYKFAVRRVDRWKKRLGPVPVSAPSWLEVFTQHPEFFSVIRLSDGTLEADPQVALAWRRSKERNYDTFKQESIGRDEAKAIAETDPEDGATRLSRPPLSTTEISLLVQLALDLHERELKHQQERRWWYAVVLGVAGLVASAFSHLL